MMRRNIITVLFVLTLTLVMAGPASRAASPDWKGVAVEGVFAQPPLPQGVQRITSVEGITEYRLSNGLRVLLFPDPSKPTITVNITYLVGSKHENYGETGMAHLLEHLLFKGTPKHPNIYQELTERGGRANGTTWFDRTNYFITFPASDANLQWALELEADRMVNSFIAKKDLDSEMTVVRNEFEAGENDPFNVLLERMLSTAYLWHNYGKSTIGARSDIENVPIERLQAFYRTYYQPDNAILLVAGKIDEARTLELIARYFGPIPRPTRTLPTFYTIEPTQDGERLVTLRRVGDVQLVGACYHIPAGAHPDSAALDILTQILSDTPSGRLYKALVETKKATRVYGFAFQLREPGVVLLGAEVRQDASLDAARDALLQTIEEFAKTPPTAEEVERARTQLLKQIELNLNSPDRVGIELSEWAAMGDWRLLFLHRDRLRRVRPEDVQRVAAAYLKPSNRTLGLFYPTPAPDRAEIPATPDIAALLKDYKGGEAVTAGEAFDPSPANIEARTIRTTLPGGAKLAMLPKKTRGNAVFATLVFHLGDEKSLMNRRLAGELTAQMLMRGTTRRTRQQIQDEFDRLKARISIFGGPTIVRASVETIRENLPAVLRLVAEILREPSFPAAEFDLLKQELLAGLEQQRSEPGAVAVRALRRHLSPYPRGDVRYVSTLDEEIEELKAVTLDEVKKFYADFYGGQYGEIAVVGDFDDREIATLLGELFGRWKNPRPFSRIVSVYRDVPAINQSFETPDKANAFFFAGMNLNVRQDDPDYPALVLGNYLLGGGFLNSRLAVRLRQKEGLSYGAGSELQADPLDKAGIFLGYAIYAPQNVARLETAFKEEIERALREGFTPDEIKAAKTGWLQAQEVSRAQERELVGRLAMYLFLNRTLAWDAELEKKIQALTPEEIVAALRRHIDPSRISIVKAGDFAKAAKSEAKK
ncbi:MAG TPA: pitrilysin family protein [Blastocatellia bacterium]|nr:pitrilysin family protein [Blastocatellia bacterium]